MENTLVRLVSFSTTIFDLAMNRFVECTNSFFVFGKDDEDNNNIIVQVFYFVNRIWQKSALGYD